MKSLIRKKSSTIINEDDFKYVIKPKNRELREVFEYLDSRGFSNYPKLLDKDVEGHYSFEYLEEVNTPLNQKAQDLIRTVGMLHSKTEYTKEVSEDTFKEIYENIKGNLLYYKDYYKGIVLEIEKHVFMSPSEYLFIRNYSRIDNQIKFVLDNLDKWYETIKDKRFTKVSAVHNNLSVDHYLSDKLISWDKTTFDSPVLDIYNFYKNEALNLEFMSIFEEYFKYYDMDKEDKDLLYILLCIPLKIEFNQDEFTNCVKISDALDYSIKSEYLAGPYYSIDKKE